MSLPTAYLTSVKNLSSILDAVQKAQAPPRFTQKYLEGLGFSYNGDRLVINLLKTLGMLSDTGEPLQKYHQFLDPAQSRKVLGKAMQEAYSDLYQINKEAHKLSTVEVKNKMKTLSQGQYSDSVLSKMASTFKKLAEQADFHADAGTQTPKIVSAAAPKEEKSEQSVQKDAVHHTSHSQVAGLVYNINIHLPESRDPAVYDALFKSLHNHLL